MRRLQLVILLVLALSSLPPSLAHGATIDERAAAAGLSATLPGQNSQNQPDAATTTLRRTKRGQRPPSYNPSMRDPQAYADAKAAGYNGPAAPDLDTLMASGVISNPLAGSDVIGLNDQYMVLFDGTTYPSIQPLNSSYGAAGNLISGSGPSPWPGGSLWQASMGAAAADINGDYVDDLITVANFGAGGSPCIGPVVTSFNADLTMKTQQPPNPLSPSSTNCETNIETNLYLQTARLATGNFYPNGANNGNGQQVVMAWNNGATLCVRVWDNNPNGTLTQNPALCTNGPVMTYDPVSSGPYPGILQVAAGDLNNDGADEIVVGFVEPGGIGYDVWVLTAAKGAAPIVTAKANYGRPDSYYTEYQISIALGDFDGSGSKSIAVVTQDQQDVFAYLWIVNAALNGISQGGQSPFRVAGSNMEPGSYWGQVAAVAAPFLAGKPGIDELAIVWQKLNYNNGFQWYATGFLSLFDLQGQKINAPLLPEQELFKGFATSVFVPMSAAAAFPGPNVATAKLLIGAPGLSTDTNQWVTVSAFTFSLNGNKATASGGEIYGNPSEKLRVASPYGSPLAYGTVNVVPGDFAGLSVHLQLLSKQELPSLVQVMSELRAPPTHTDMFPEIGPTATVNLDVNYPDPNCENVYNQDSCSYVRYEDQTQQGTSQTIGYKRNWSIASTTSVDVPDIIDASLTASYGQNFDKTTQSITNLSTTSGVGSGQDDVLLYTETDFAIWEYAAYRQGQIVTYVAVIFPDVICTANSCTPNSFPAEAAGNSIPWYYPNTEPGNVLSYPTIAPTDILTPVLPLNQTPQMVLGTDFTNLLVNSSQQNVTTENKTVNVGIQSQVNSGFDIFGAGVKVELKGDYSKSNISGQSLSFDQSTSIRVNYAGLSTTPFNNPQYGDPSQWSYSVRPFIYDSTGTFLRVNYQVSIPTGETSPWSIYYGQLPDFAFIRRNRFSDLNTNLTTDIRFTEGQTPTVGQPITIQGVIRNFSLLPFAGPAVDVAFYNGNPAQGGTLIGTQQVTSIPAQGSAQVNQTFTPSAAGCAEIWSVIDPQNKLKEIHKANNTGFTTLAVFSANGGGNDPCGSAALENGRQTVFRIAGGAPDLAVTASDLSFTLAATPQITRPITLTANVRASGAHYSNVAVMFYDGDPRHGGAYIGSDLIPLIWSGFTAHASVRWQPKRPFGRHEIFVRVRPIAGQEVNYSNNIAVEFVDLGGNTVLLPSVPQRITYAVLGATSQTVRRRRVRRRAG